MKKFEKLNKEKFLLKPQKMGELVGGAKIVEQSGPGRTRIWPSKTWIPYSSDTTTYDSQSDKKANIASNFTYSSDMVNSQTANTSIQAN